MVFSADAPFLIVAPPEGHLSGRQDNLEHPDSAVLCIRRAAPRAALLRDPAPASDSVLGWVRVQASDNVPVAALERPASFRLRVKRRGRSVPVRASAAAARHTRRPRKAR